MWSLAFKNLINLGTCLLPSPTGLHLISYFHTYKVGSKNWPFSWEKQWLQKTYGINQSLTFILYRDLSAWYVPPGPVLSQSRQWRNKMFPLVSSRRDGNDKQVQSENTTEVIVKLRVLLRSCPEESIFNCDLEREDSIMKRREQREPCTQGSKGVAKKRAGATPMLPSDPRRNVHLAHKNYVDTVPS